MTKSVTRSKVFLTEDYIKRIPSKDTLNRASFPYAQVEDPTTLKAFEQFVKVTNLSFQHACLQDKHLEGLAAPYVRTLNLNYTQVTKDGILSLRTLPELKVLHLKGCASFSKKEIEAAKKDAKRFLDEVYTQKYGLKALFKKGYELLFPK